MAQKTEDSRRVRVRLNQVELNTILVQPAKDAGFIDFDPTRINTRALDGGGFEITFERVEGNANT